MVQELELGGISARTRSPRLLVIDGNPAATRHQQVAAGGTSPGEGYAALLRELSPGIAIDLCFPADGAVELPAGMAIEGYDGAVITGSPLHVYDGGPAVTRQIALVRAVLDAGVPAFGSCWGLQVITAAAGGSIRANPRGREIVYGRNIRLSAAGRDHPLYAGKPSVFDAVTFHLDEVETAAPGTTVLAANDTSDIQALAIERDGADAWAVQYHPEFPLREVAAIVRRSPTLIDEGFFADQDALARYADELDALDRDPGDAALAARHEVDGAVLDKAMRTREVANWIEQRVLPRRARHDRG